MHLTVLGLSMGTLVRVCRAQCVALKHIAFEKSEYGKYGNGGLPPAASLFCHHLVSINSNPPIPILFIMAMTMMMIMVILMFMVIMLLMTNI